jgi:hypothetical protein
MPKKPKTPLDNSISKLMNEKVPGDKEGRTFSDLAAIAVVKAGLSGDRKFLRQLVSASKTKSNAPVEFSDSDTDKDESEIAENIHSALDSQLG